MTVSRTREPHKNVGLHTRDICITVGSRRPSSAEPPSGIMKKNYASVFLTGVYYATKSRERFVSHSLGE